MALKFNDLSAGVQAAVLIVVAAALAGALFWYFALPESDQLDSLQQQVKRLRAENDRNEAFKREQTEYLNRIAQLSEQLKTLQSIVPDDPSTDVFVRSVYDTGANSDVHIRSFISEPLVSKELYVEMPFRLHLDGTYYRLLQFFDRLAHDQRIVTVSNLALSGPEGGGMGSYKVSVVETVGANCVITTYYNRPAPEPKAGGKKGPK
ncbi:MAG TPA: type 4a pilus biogenesis protein PilO [Terriglobia bacterium]|nr:type 4a pilus biogenesis protein PilO [Terriglobia bacterium]